MKLRWIETNILFLMFIIIRISYQMLTSIGTLFRSMLNENLIIKLM